MKETMFTPAPLHAKRAHAADNTGGYDWCVCDGRNRIVAECFEHIGFSMEVGRYVDSPAEANSRLYAASPELVSALERLRGAFKGLLAGTPVRDAEETLAEVDDALSKARGETDR